MTFILKFSVILAGVFLLNSASMSASNIDSLKNVAKQSNIETQISTYNEIAKLYWNSSTDSAYKYAMKALLLNKKDDFQKALSLKSIGISSFYSTQYDSALYYYQLADEIFTELKENKDHANILSNIALIYANTGKNVKAIETHLKALAIREEIRDTSGMFISFMSLSNVYEETEQYNLSKKMLDKALVICDTSNIYLYSNLLSNLAALHATQSQYKKAIYNYRKAYNLHLKANGEINAAIAASNMGNNYIMLGKFDDGLKWVYKSIVIFEKNNFDRGLIASYQYIGEAYFKKKNFLSAKTYFLKSLNLSNKHKILSWQRNTMNSLSETYFKLSNLDSCFHYSKKYFLISDSLKNIANMEQIAEMEAKYETEKKEKQIQSLKLEKAQAEATKRKQQVIGLIVFGSLTLILLVVILIFNRYILKQKIKHQQNEQAKLKLVNEQAKLENSLLRTQINPHFIFNSLNSVNSFIIDNNIDDAQTFIAKFARLMRLILDNSSKEYVSFESELDTLTLYLELEQQRFRNSFVFNIDVDNNIDPEFTDIPPMLTQPFIENSLIHGLAHLNGVKGILDIKYSLIKNGANSIICTITDNGIGREASKKINQNKSKKNKSKGILISKERLQKLNKGNNKQFDVDITDLYDSNENAIGTKATLSFPAVIDD